MSTGLSCGIYAERRLSAAHSGVEAACGLRSYVRELYLAFSLAKIGNKNKKNNKRSSVDLNLCAVNVVLQSSVCLPEF